jgi:hypothetical protein
MIIHIFLARGGYFGQLKNKTFSMDTLIKTTAQDIDDGKPLEEANIDMWHEVLIHGITPNEFQKRLIDTIEDF